MIFKTIVHCVNFGEYIECIDNTSNKNILTIDCGCKNGRVKNTNNLSFEIPIMISHLHIDHYSGYLDKALKENKKFKKVYLPKISSKVRKTLLKNALYDLCINGSQSSYDSIKALKDILTITDVSNIEFVEFGNEINEINGLVLWPKALILEEYIVEEFSKHETNFITDLDDFNENLNIINEMCEYVFGSQEITMNTISNSPTFIADFGKVLENLRKRVKTSKNYKISKILRKNENSYSIVVKTEEWVFTGDLPLEIQKNHLKNLYKDVKKIKIPHHGTKDYLNICDLNYTVNDAIKIVSNGSMKKWKISEGIGYLSNVNCTSLNCTCYDSFGKCIFSHKCHKKDFSI